MSDGKSRHVVVVGAGIVGVSSAIWLLRRGHGVTIVDDTPERGRASFGNAGVLAASSIVPVTVPGLVGKAPRMALDPTSPLFLRWSYLPRLFPWLVRYLAHCNEADVTRIAHGLAPLTKDTVAQHRDLSAGTPAASWLEESGYLYAYPSRAAFAADGFAWRLRREAGFAWDELDGAALAAFDPNLGPGIGLGILMRDHGFVLSPGAYLQDLTACATSLGANHVKARAEDVRLGPDGAFAAVVAPGREIAGDVAVIATGAWSKAITAKLGLSVPLETERGYHVMLRGASSRPRCPTAVTAGKFVATPMKDGVRCAGIVEFAGLDAPPDRRPIELVLTRLREAYPGLTYDSHEEWMGHRPAPSDSLPLIGPAPGRSGIFLAFGHHHVGLTCGPKTGRLVAAMIDGADPGIDMRPYAPSRFSARSADRAAVRQEAA